MFVDYPNDRATLFGALDFYEQWENNSFKMVILGWNTRVSMEVSN